jgi:dihydrofolate reductase
MANYVFIATSLDGFIAAIDGDIDWLEEVPNPEGSDFGYADFMRGIDALVMGRNTFEKVLGFGFWPYDKPVYVASSGEVQIPEDLAGKAEGISGTPKEIVADMKGRGHENLYVDGGITIQRFLEEDLIDEMTINKIPVLLGDGIPLFGKLAQRRNFKLVNSEILVGEMVKSHYQRIRE